MSRFFTLVAGLALLACAVMAGIEFQVPRIEADLAARARAAADKAHLDWLGIEAHGQTLMLTGNAPDYRARRDAENLDVDGVTAVDSRIVLVGAGDSCAEEIQAFTTSDPVRFPTGSDVITSEGEKLLARLASVARNCEVEVAVAFAARVGSGDAREPRLERTRLEAVRRYLLRSGVPETLLVGGSSNPKIVEGDQGKARYVEVWVVEDAT